MYFFLIAPSIPLIAADDPKGAIIFFNTEVFLFVFYLNLYQLTCCFQYCFLICLFVFVLKIAHEVIVPY